MKRLGMKWMMAVALGLVAGSQARATEYFVDALHGVDDTNDALTPDTAWRTIQRVLNDKATTPGDIVTVIAGTYLQGFGMTPVNSGVTVRARGDVVLTLGTGVSGVTDAVIEGVTFFRTTVSVTSGNNLLMKRCRFIQADVGVQVSGGATEMQIRECLFVGNPTAAIHVINNNFANVFVDRCTLAASGGMTFTGQSGAVVSNTVFYENTPSTPAISYTHCCFIGEPLKGVGAFTIDEQTEPLFIDPDNRVYFVEENSALLTGGIDGGPVGAFGRGFHGSRVAAVNHIPSAPWAGWVDQDNVAINSGNSMWVELNDDNEVLLKDGVMEAPIYSEVYNTGSRFTVLRSVDFAAFEDTSLDPGMRQVIDQQDSSTNSLREIRFRYHPDTMFDGDPTCNPCDPDFTTVVDKQKKLNIRAQYVQLELVLRNNSN